MQIEYKYLDEVDQKEFRDDDSMDYYDTREIKAQKIVSGIVLPYKLGKEPGISYGGVTEADGTYVESSAQRIVGTEMSMGYVPKNCNTDARSVVWFGGFHTHWGHFLTEMVSRCWYFVQHASEVKDLYVAYVRRTDICEKQISGNYMEFLELLGIDKSHMIEVTEPTQFAEVIVPDLSCRSGVFYTEEFKSIFNTIRDNVNLSEPTYEKVYFTRLMSKSFRNTEIGEKKIKKLFQANQYKVIAPEHCTLKQQIHYIKNSKQLTVISGTLPHNILFAQDHVNLTIINRAGDSNYYQAMINQVRDAKVTYVDAHLSLLPVFANGPFLMCVTDNLLQYARDNQFKIPGKMVDNPIVLHMKLTWYFLYYLEAMSGDTVRRWNLEEKYGPYIMSRYAYYRDRIPDYDKKTLHRLRKCFYILTEWIG